MITLIIISFLGMGTLLFGALQPRRQTASLVITWIGLLTALAALRPEWNQSHSYYHEMVIFDNFAVAFSAILIIATLLIFLLAYDYYPSGTAPVADILGLMIFTLVGGICLVSYGHMAMLYLGVEIVSIPLYILAGSKKNHLSSNEAALKYFLTGSFASPFLLFGIALIYGATGSLHLSVIQNTLTHSAVTHSTLIMLGTLLILIGFAAKVAVVPFHFWSPDVYQGAPTLITCYMITVAKVAGFAAFYRLFTSSLNFLTIQWNEVIGAIAVLSLIGGNLLAMQQRSLKRLLAYSSIGHAGFLLLGLLVLNRQAINALWYYSVAYVIALIGVFAILIAIKKETKTDDLYSLRGLAKANPFMAFGLSVALLSLAGIPPFAGFFAKYLYLLIAVQNHYLGIAIIAIIASVIGAGYYLRLISLFYQSDESTALPQPIYPLHFSSRAIILLSIFLTILFGLFPNPLIAWH